MARHREVPSERVPSAGWREVYRELGVDVRQHD